MKEKAKKLWEKYGLYVMVLAYGLGFYALGCFVSSKVDEAWVDAGFNRIADVTPELTFGDFKKQCLSGTFDINKYKA